MSPRPFTRFVCIDWSGQAVAHPQGIALAEAALGTAAPRLIRPTGGWSREAIVEWLLAEARTKSDLLIGMDFSFAFPFSDCGAYFPGWPASPADARMLWAHVERICADDPHLGCAAFVAHTEAARHFRRHGLGAGDRFTSGNGRLRVTETACRVAGLGPAQSSFNLVGPAQVGKSSLTGMRLLHRLNGTVPIWPFDPPPQRGPVLVEMYTTVAARAAGRGPASKIRDAAALDRALATLGSDPHEPLSRYDDHATDALVGAAWLRRVATDRALWRAAPDGTHATEGWTFGVT